MNCERKSRNGSKKPHLKYIWGSTDRGGFVFSNLPRFLIWWLKWVVLLPSDIVHDHILLTTKFVNILSKLLGQLMISNAFHRSDVMNPIFRWQPTRSRKTLRVKRAAFCVWVNGSAQVKSYHLYETRNSTPTHGGFQLRVDVDCIRDSVYEPIVLKCPVRGKIPWLEPSTANGRGSKTIIAVTVATTPALYPIRLCSVLSCFLLWFMWFIH